MRNHLPSEDDVPTLSEFEGIRYLHLGTEWVQGAMRLRRPAELVLEYTAQMMAWLMFCRPQASQNIGILGLGAGSLLRFCLKHTPSQIYTAEWNPEVTAMCRMYFKLSDNKRSSIDHVDAALWLKEHRNIGRFVALMVDLYDAHAQGPVRDSLEFYQDCYRSLDESAAMTVNLFGEHGSYAHNLANIKAAFDGNCLELPLTEAGNRIVLAWKGPFLAITTGELLKRAEALEQETRLPAVRWARHILDQLHPVTG